MRAGRLLGKEKTPEEPETTTDDARGSNRSWCIVLLDWDPSDISILLSSLQTKNRNTPSDEILCTKRNGRDQY